MKLSGFSRLSMMVDKSKLRESFDKADKVDISPEVQLSSTPPIQMKSSIEASSLKSGFLWKKGGGTKSTAWKLRWFELTPEFLYYFKNQTDLKPAGHIAIAGYKTEMFKETRKPYAFQLLDPSNASRRVYFFSAASNEDRENWLEVLQQAMTGSLPNDRNLSKIEGRLKSNSYKIGDDELAWSDEILGKGGSGIIRKATWLGCTTVAVKTLNNIPEFIENHELSSFYKEIEMLSTLRHPNIVSMFGYCRKGSYLCLVTEYVKGGNMHDIIHDVAKYKYNPLEVALSICRGMLYLHSKNIIHRDLKPGNILVESLEDSRLKICDFGLSKVTKMNATSQHSIVTAAGTPSFAAPELLGGKHTDKVDVFSYGMILWSVYAREVLWPQLKHPWEISEKILAGERPSIPKTCPLTVLISKCWHQDPNIRPNFKQIYEELLLYQEISTGLNLSGSGETAVKTETGLEVNIMKEFSGKTHVEWKEFSTILMNVTGVQLGILNNLKPLFCNAKDGKVHRIECERILMWFTPLIKEDDYVTRDYFDENSIEQENGGKIGYTFQDIMAIITPPWFYGFVSNSELNFLLENKPENSFLFRFSTSNPGSYALSVNYPGGIGHFRIGCTKVKGHCVFSIDSRNYLSINQIIEEHTANTPLTILRGEKAHEVYLKFPLDKNIDKL